MEDTRTVQRLGLFVVCVLAGTAWTVSSYLASKQVLAAEPATLQCVGCPQPEVEEPVEPDLDSFTAREFPPAPTAG